ncbi:hypothetical protein Tco_0651066 [Tanacetum coccineum]
MGCYCQWRSRRRVCIKWRNISSSCSLRTANNWLLKESERQGFGVMKESKRCRKNVLKHQFENFSTTSNESMDKAYDRFQKLISQLEVHGAPISKEDINQKFLRSLPLSWNLIALIMENISRDIDKIDY